MAYDFYTQTSGNFTATSGVKDVTVKLVKLVNTDFTTGGANSVKAVLPADSTILGFEYWKKTAFSGGGVTAVTLSVGIPGTATQFVNGVDVHSSAAGTDAKLTPSTNIMQPLSLPQGSDIQLLFTGTATTGSPTAGELYVKIFYVR